MQKILLLLSIVMTLIPSLYALPVEPLAETIVWEGDKVPTLSLLPDVPGASEIRKRFENYRPEITVHRLYRLETDTGSEDVLYLLLNILSDTGSQTGYTYHSHRRDEQIELIEESYRVDERGRKVDDLSFPDPQQLPESVEFRQYIREANFRGAVFQQSLQIGDTYISYTSTNIDRLWYGIIPLIRPGGVRNEYLAFFHEGQWYLYMASQIQKMPGINRLLGEPVHIPSFYGKRMDVANEWLTDQLQRRRVNN